MSIKYQLRRQRLYFTASVIAFGLLVATPVPAAAANAVTMTVTAVGKKDSAPPPIKKEDVELFQGKERMQVADWKRGDTLFLAILIDDSLDSEAASQWNDLKAFINAQPQNTYVAVAYARNGTAMVAQDFTNDHALAAKALRIPLGGQGAFSSPYLALQDWLKRWPSSAGDRRSIVMISSGVDYFRGGFDPIDPDLDSTIERAQKENINVWTIYYPDEGHAGRRYFRVFNAQSNLSRLSEETGAESYYLELGRPVSLKPYFDEIQSHLNNQYLLTFEGSGGGKKGKFERVRVATEIPKVEFITPSEVFLPASQ
jgi:VWFA-related protein